MNNLKILTIVHGKSELIICKCIKSNLKIKQEIMNDPNSSIQVTSIMKFLNKPCFKTFNAFVNKFDSVVCDKKKQELLDFNIFIIMDIDDCSDEQKVNFKNGSLFKFHWLYPYIIPIFNNPNLETPMEYMGYRIQNKSKDYKSYFPINNGSDLDLEQTKILSERLRNCPKNMTNMYLYIDKCIEIAESNLIK